MADKSTDTSKSEDEKKNDKFSKEEIEKLLGTTVSSGYTPEEIEKIIESAEPVYAGETTTDFSMVRPKHKNTRHMVWDWDKEELTNPECYFEVNGQPLRVNTEFTVTPDTEIDETRLFSGFDTTDKSAVKHLYFKGNAGYTVECSVVVRSDDIYIGNHVGDINYDSDTTVASVLMDWERLFQVCVIITDSPIVQNGYYRLKIEDITQVYHNLIKFQLRFIQDTYHYNTDLQTYGALSKAVNVLKTGNTAYYDSSDFEEVKKPVKVNTDTTTKVKEDVLITHLNNCPTIRRICSCVSYKKKSCITSYLACSYYYQEALKKLGYYLDGKHDGLFCYLTHKATLKFQRDNKITVDGIVGPETKGVLIAKLKKL